jgi:hypothetical protein
MKKRLTGRCIICGQDSDEDKEDIINGKRTYFIDCPTCHIKYLIGWMVLRTFKANILGNEEGIKLKEVAMIENKKGQRLLLNIPKFRELFGTYPQSYEAGGQAGTADGPREKGRLDGEILRHNK